jgi:hypothetical protein
MAKIAGFLVTKNAVFQMAIDIYRLYNELREK